MSCVFAEDGDLLVPTVQARGPWDPQAMHGGAPSAVLARAIEAVAPQMRIARMTVEFLGAVPLAPVHVEAEVTRPGRRIQVAEASLSAGGRERCRARASLIRRDALDGLPDASAEPPPAPGPDALERSPFLDQVGEGFHLSAMDIRFVSGAFDERGPGVAWFRLTVPLVEGEELTAVQRAVAAADFANGISQILDWRTWLFVNTDLTVHLHREPEGAWIGLDARTVVEDNGSGLAASTLYDRRGPVGRGAQSLFVAPG